MNNQSKSLTLKDYIAKTLFLVLLMLGLFVVFANNSSTKESLIMESLVFFVLIIATSHLYFNNSKLTSFFVLAYVVKLLIGVLHYLYFIDSNYFNTTGGAQALHQEFQAVTSFLETAVSNKEEFGLFFITLDGFVTHQELLSIIAIPFRFFGVRILNIAPINSFFSLLAAMNVFMLIDKEKIDNQTSNLILFLLSYCPVTLITSFFYRDIVGWALISIGIVLMTKSERVSTRIASMIVAMLLFYLQRNAYVVLPVAILIAQYSFLNKNKTRGMIFLPLVLIIALIVLPFAIGLASNESVEAYVEGSTKWPIYLLPIKIIVGLIGPFPWSNFILWKSIPEISYYLGDYAMGCLNIALVLCVLFCWKKLKLKSMTECTVLGVMLLLMGVLNKYMHMSYVSIGIFFLLPWIVAGSGYEFFKKYNVVAIVGMMVLNIIFIGFSLGGVGSIVR